MEPRKQKQSKPKNKKADPFLLLVGLGNVGRRYQETRHNTGFLAIDSLASLLHVDTFSPRERLMCDVAMSKTKSGKILLAKPTTMMNASGKAVQRLASWFHVPLERLWIVHDELDLPFGTIRHSFESRAAGNRGVQSVIDELGTNAFHRLRIGIGRPTSPLPADRYVLQPFSKTEMARLKKLLEETLSTFLREQLGVASML